MARAKESAEERAFRHEACRAMKRRLQTRFVTCCVHGIREEIAEVYGSNNWEWEDYQLRCDPTHPGCFNYFTTGRGASPEPKHSETRDT